MLSQIGMKDEYKPITYPRRSLLTMQSLALAEYVFDICIFKNMGRTEKKISVGIHKNKLLRNYEREDNWYEMFRCCLFLTERHKESSPRISLFLL